MSKKKYISTKVFDGFSCCFRQWKAEGTHCKFLHGYGVSIKVWFEGDLDQRNWVMDFGIGSRSKNLIDGKTLKEYLNWLLDHTVLVAEDDPMLSDFKELDSKGVIQLRILRNVGAEKFAEFLLNKISDWCIKETSGRVKVKKLKFSEHKKNSAIVYNTY